MTQSSPESPSAQEDAVAYLLSAGLVEGHDGRLAEVEGGRWMMVRMGMERLAASVVCSGPQETVPSTFKEYDSIDVPPNDKVLG